MATRKKYDLAVKVGSYTDATGQQKNRYQNVGAVMEKDDGGKFLMLAKWFNPAGVHDERGGESILISMFEPKQNGGAQEQTERRERSKTPTTAPPEDDDIPF